MGFRKRAGNVQGPPYWILARAGDPERKTVNTGRIEEDASDVLTVRAGTGGVLPLFGSKESATSFVDGASAGNRHICWRATEIGAGELLRLLSDAESSGGLCEGVKEIAFDPPRSIIEPSVRSDTLDPPTSEVPTVGRKILMDRLLGRGGRWSGSR